MAMQESNHRINKRYFIKSILENYYSQGYVNLNSRASKNQDKNFNCIKEYNTKTINFEIKIEGIESKFTKAINIIDNIEQCIFINWLEEFENLAEANRWTAKQIMLIMNNLIEDKNVDKKRIVEDFKTTRSYLLNVAYPKEKVGAIVRKLENIFQKNFTYIGDYYNEIKKNLDIYSIHGNVTRTEYSRRFEEYFNRGLGKYTYNEIVRKDFKDV
ncbi:hypothetical protein DMUE_5999 [Dictyocoela muelleri]|nr:hypothetical protein DMUE_5999 [Dictyocoela muelleri]